MIKSCYYCIRGNLIVSTEKMSEVYFMGDNAWFTETYWMKELSSLQHSFACNTIEQIVSDSFQIWLRSRWLVWDRNRICLKSAPQIRKNTKRTKRKSKNVSLKKFLLSSSRGSPRGFWYRCKQVRTPVVITFLSVVTFVTGMMNNRNPIYVCTSYFLSYIFPWAAAKLYGIDEHRWNNQLLSDKQLGESMNSFISPHPRYRLNILKRWLWL